MNMKKFFLIYNEGSSSNSMASILTEIIPTYQKAGILLTTFCLNLGEKEDFLPILKKGSYEGILISGGDGSIHSVLSFLLNHDIDLPVGLIPAGTCNDLSNSLGLPKNNLEAALIPLKNNIKTIDIGLINNDRFFFSSCAGGYFMPDDIDKSPNFFKKLIKKFAYYIRAALRFNRFKPFNVKITMNDEVYELKAMMFGIATGSQVAGFGNILKQAELDDGLLDIFVIDNVSYLQAHKIVLDIIRGKFIEHKRVHYLKGTSLRIEGPNSLPIVFDGEPGNTLPLDISVSEKRIKIFY